MAKIDRQNLMADIESLRDGRRLISFFNFDRISNHILPGVETSFQVSAKEPLFRVLKETIQPDEKIDLYFYTRGGEVNAVWPIISLLREFDPDFEVLVPYMCHSAGTLLVLGAKKIHLTPLSELGPIDPEVGGPFNPPHPRYPGDLAPVSVEDVQAYRKFCLDQLQLGDPKDDPAETREHLKPFLLAFTQALHPLALGNVHRAHLQIKRLGAELLKLHGVEEEKAK